MPAIDVTVHYLEMPARGDLRQKFSSRPGVVFSLVPSPIPELNRFFYAAIGGDWFWLERRQWTLAQWLEWLNRPELETWVLSVDGIPAGYVEIEKRTNGDAELMYFGLLAPFVGWGLGAHLLSVAVSRAWDLGASRVMLNTCTLDHPGALGNYLARGFREYRTEVKRKEIPVEKPGPWEGATSP